MKSRNVLAVITLASADRILINTTDWSMLRFGKQQNILFVWVENASPVYGKCENIKDQDGMIKVVMLRAKPHTSRIALIHGVVKLADASCLRAKELNFVQ